jgi:hypothetical protein
MIFPRILFRRDALPHFLIIGAQKAGTTSLASYLAAHPGVVPSKRKEVHFFDLNYEKGVDWYRSHFPIARGQGLRCRMRGRRMLTGEASPYYIFHPLAASRAFDLLPTARVIVLLRNPVDRAYSHYHHEVRLGAESLSFEDAIGAEDHRIADEGQRLALDSSYMSFNYLHFAYLKRGIYADQIRRWLRYYRPEQFLIVSSEQFFKDPASEYQRVLQFLDLPPWDLPAYPAELVGTYRPMPAATHRYLREYFAPHNSALRRLLNSVWPGTGDVVLDGFSRLGGKERSLSKETLNKVSLSTGM